MVVIDAKGSSPGKQGFAMAVCEDGSLFGSIGGGAMEFNLVEECKLLLKNNQKLHFSKKQNHEGDKKNSTGMICSGTQTVDFIHICMDNKKTINEISSCIENNKTGILELSKNNFKFTLTTSLNEWQYQFNSDDKTNWIYQEIIGFKNTIYIIGAGHVGFAVSRIFSQLGFNVVIFDNRSELSMLDENQYANKKSVIDYGIIDQYINEGDNSFVIIMTNNHQHDINVLSRLLRKRLAYIGLMGSKSKVAKFKKSLKETGFTDSELNRVHAPIGLSINSITPDEIAISIAAEVIKIKNSKN